MSRPDPAPSQQRRASTSARSSAAARAATGTRQQRRAAARAVERAADQRSRAAARGAAARGLGSKRLTVSTAESAGKGLGRWLSGDNGAAARRAAVDVHCEAWREAAALEHGRRAAGALASCRAEHARLVELRDRTAERLAALPDCAAEAKRSKLRRLLARRIEREQAFGAIDGRLEASADERIEHAADRLAHWHETRQAALGTPFVERTQSCGHARLGAVDLGCHACGEVSSHPVACGLRQWCPSCSRRYRTSTRKRLARGLGIATRAARSAWSRAGRERGKRPELTLITLTVRHTGDLGADRSTIYDGWTALRKRLWHVDGGALPYVMAWELTPGADGLGHVHAHIACVWPFRDLRALDAAWSDVTKGAGTTVDLVGPGRAAREAARRGRLRTDSVGNAASYLTAYVDAGGMSENVPESMAAAWLGSMRQKRTWHTSRGLQTQREPAAWTPCCGSTAFFVGFRRGCNCERGAAEAQEARAGPGPPDVNVN